MLRATQAAVRAPASAARAPTRGASNRVKVMRERVLRKMRQGIERFPAEGPDPAAAYKHGWRLGAAAIVERYPVITPKLHPFEEDFETERFLAVQRVSRPVPVSMFLTERDIAAGRTEPDFSDPVADSYVPAPRTTQADRDDDRRSLKRALDERLYFVVRHGAGAAYRFPQTLVREPGADAGTPLMRLAERAFRAVTEAETRPPVFFVSYSPSCHLEHVYPLAYQQKHDVYGVKIFFYRGVLQKGEIERVRGAEDFRWARACELPELLGETYHAAVKPVLLGNGTTEHLEV